MTITYSRLVDNNAFPSKPPRLRVDNLCKKFGAFHALDGVSFVLEPGVFHALLGENGAGKSTLVKCIMGFFPPSSGVIYLDEQAQSINNPRDAQRLGLGMVYQHFTAIPALTVAENLILSQFPLPRLINWRVQRHRLVEFLASAPFQLDLDMRVSELAAGQKQKLEILRQLYLGCRILILDEPTSVLTPSEADDVLGRLSDSVKSNRLSVLMITHKFREVNAFADHVSVLRRGRLVGDQRVDGLRFDDLAEQMLGHPPRPSTWNRISQANSQTILEISDLKVERDRGLPALDAVNLSVRQGEIVGVAGISGNGQRELMEVIAGQRQASGGCICISGQAYLGTRDQMRRLYISILPEEPMHNAGVSTFSIADNLALRLFDRFPFTLGRWWLRPSAFRLHSRRLIADFKIRPPLPQFSLKMLSGGNVQRVVLARELSPLRVDLLVASNPCFGLDFDSANFIHSELISARNRGTAVLLFSEDLDELLALSDRLLVMSKGRIVYETTTATADYALIGRAMTS